MYKVCSIISFIVVLFIASILITIFKPGMHKQFFVYDYNFQIEENAAEKVKERKLVPKVESVKSKQEVTKTVEKKTVENIKPKTAVGLKPVSKKNVNNNIQEKQAQQKEEILWNKWRSDIQNNIMLDVKLPIVPSGTVFRFSFDVDKFGRVTNIKTWSEDATYTPYAIQYIAPVIRSYQGRSILNFPVGSKRFLTNVEGGWKVSDKSKLSSPDDYDDVEQIRN